MKYTKHDLENYLSVTNKWDDFKEWIDSEKPTSWY